MEVDLSQYYDFSIINMRKEVHRHRKDLGKAQKDAEPVRLEWLKKESIERAKATGDNDWEKALKEMRRIAEVRAVNRKISAVKKGRFRPLDRIQVPQHHFYYSKAANELYHYTDGNFEAYPSTGDDEFYHHHTFKVLPKDAIQALVRDTGERYQLTAILEWY